jgi:hypothetical protein
LGAVIDAQSYTVIVSNDSTEAPQPFIIPTFPGILPVVVGGNQAAREEELRVFGVSTHAWREYCNVTNALRKQILLTVEETYLSPLKDEHTGYSGTTLQDMLAHLFTAYGIIQEHDLVANEARLMESWDGSVLFETVLTCVNQCISYAAYAGNPYSPGQILAKVSMWHFRQGSSTLPAGNGKDSPEHKGPTITSRHTSSWPTKTSATSNAQARKQAMDWQHRQRRWN